METQIHFLKTHQQVYIEMELGKKLFEIRKNDRDFRVGDYLCLQETREIDDMYTENEMIVSVSFILAGDLAERYGLKDGHCAMSIVKLNPQLQLVLRQQMYRWDDKLAILFSRQEVIDIVRELKRVRRGDLLVLLDEAGIPLTSNQVMINLIRQIEVWYDVNNIKERGMSIDKQVYAFAVWLGW